MAPSSYISGTWLPFLYPCLSKHILSSVTGKCFPTPTRCFRRYNSSVVTSDQQPKLSLSDASPSLPTSSHLNPSPDSYSASPFIDCCTISVHAGGGGHGCVSFLREKYIEAGPANGGDGGTGGNVYIQAVRGETSLHRLARRGMLRAGNGQNGQGKGQGGQRGKDVLITVPVGTVVREFWRHDPVEIDNERILREHGGEATVEGDQARRWMKDKWILYPGGLPSSYLTVDFPALPRPRRSNLVLDQPRAPVMLDLDEPMERPLLLAAGAMGGLGNPHFVTRNIPRPKFATKGDGGLTLKLQLELKLLADVGLVGFPNAGKSTLLRALSNSRTRVGSWAFTTLQPQIGTVVLDSLRGRPHVVSLDSAGKPRTSFTIADIPGLIEDAHLDKGLGLGFLRHVERAAILAFVVDLSSGDPVATLQSLWKEVGEYETMKAENLNSQTEQRFVGWRPSNDRPGILDDLGSRSSSPSSLLELGRSPGPPISAKPWLVIATKADLSDTHDKFAGLKAYLESIAAGTVAHPSGRKNGWRKRLDVIPVSALRGEGVNVLPRLIANLWET